MKIKFWGVRGSIAAPGAATVRYGGNTTCIEVRSDAGNLIILDAGTGIFPLAQELLRSLPVVANIFLTHTHWDHIQGLPFFTPFYIPGNRVVLHGAYDIVADSGPTQVMDVQLQYSYFPIREAELRAAVEYKILTAGVPVTVGDATVSSLLLNHPVINFGYRIDCNGKSVFFTGDHEPERNIYDPGDEDYTEYQRFIDEKQAGRHAAMRGLDVMIVDCAYTVEEYVNKHDWGHGTFDGAIAWARRVGARKLICTHHEPTRSDDELERVFAQALARMGSLPDDPEILLAREGMEIIL